MRALAAVVVLCLVRPSAAADPGEPVNVRVCPSPRGEELSADYAVTVGGKSVPVYVAKVAPADATRRWKAMDDKVNSADYFDKASFACFDMGGPAAVTVVCLEDIRTAKILPTSYGIVPKVEGKSLTFALASPRHLTIEVNGNWAGSLHIFANPFEVEVPRADDPNVVYFGPGIHEVREGMEIGDGKTVYVAGGAIVRGVGKGGPVFSLHGKNIVLRGRGIIDGSLSPTHSRHLLSVQGGDITIEGVILRDSSTWTIPIRRSDRVTVRNVKVLGYRANSDGIDICNSRDVTVEGCFLRTLDDLIVVKSDAGQGEVRRIVAKNCVLWNQVAHALSVGAELRQTVDDVLFTDCDVIHDTGREWTLRVYHCDGATVGNVRFENIRIEESPKLISVWIGKAVWSRDAERGHIKGITFKDIVAASAEPPRVELRGFDTGHAVEDITFQNVRVNDKPLAPAGVKANEFVKQVIVR
ncbi:MAG: glycosyl hydrolase family 28 protein [Tepidisphaeraceae bacterium]